MDAFQDSKWNQSIDIRIKTLKQIHESIFFIFFATGWDFLWVYIMKMMMIYTIPIHGLVLVWQPWNDLSTQCWMGNPCDLWSWKIIIMKVAQWELEKSPLNGSIDNSRSHHSMVRLRTRRITTQWFDWCINFSQITKAILK